MGRRHVQKMTRRAGALVAALLMAALPARAAIPLEPGEWQDTETGTEDGQPVKPEVTTSCMTADDAKDVVKALSRLQDTAGQQCKTMHVQDKGNTLSFDMECGDAKQILIAVSMIINFTDSRHFSGTIKSNVAYGGKTVTSDKQLNSKWVAAACKKQ
jgi:hypothetical protein